MSHEPLEKRAIAFWRNNIEPSIGPKNDLSFTLMADFTRHELEEAAKLADGMIGATRHEIARVIRELAR